MRCLLVALMLGVVAFPADAQDHYNRSRAVEAEFQHLKPCPSTEQTTGPCPGFVKDHIWPLGCGGPDTVENLQWQTIDEAKAKDRLEQSRCRGFRPTEQRRRATI